MKEMTVEVPIAFGKQTLTIQKSDLDADGIAWFERVNPGYKLTGWEVVILNEQHHDILGDRTSKEVKPIFKGGRCTQYQMARLTKGKVVIAWWDRYYTIDVKTGEFCPDADNVN